MKSVRQRIKINGNITWNCEYCKQPKYCYCGEIKGTGETFKLCADCMEALYGFKFKKKREMF